MKKRFLRNVEWGILICSVILLLIGLIALFSATQGNEYSELKKQRAEFLKWLYEIQDIEENY